MFCEKQYSHTHKKIIYLPTLSYSILVAVYGYRCHERVVEGAAPEVILVSKCDYENKS